VVASEGHHETYRANRYKRLKAAPNQLQVNLSKIKKNRKQEEKQGTTPFFLGDFSSGTFYEVRGQRPLLNAKKLKSHATLAEGNHVPL
jgi:hypothetical protein